MLNFMFSANLYKIEKKAVSEQDLGLVYQSEETPTAFFLQLPNLQPVYKSTSDHQ